MHFETYTGGFTETNGYLLETPDGGHLLIDAPAGVADWLDGRGVKPSHLLLTHQHFDHVEGAAAVQELGAELLAWSAYSPGLTLEDAASGWGLPIRIRPFTVDRTLEGDAQLELAGLAFALAHVPGHSPDGLSFHHAPSGLCFCGDTVFAGSIGRTDLPGGDHALFIRCIREQLLTLPPETRLLPGHGPATTVGTEQRSNPFLG
jgi:glyoxylase-like metal-dependent hydrolase (beta-lactamase superfamily II)